MSVPFSANQSLQGRVRSVGGRGCWGHRSEVKVTSCGVCLKKAGGDPKLRDVVTQGGPQQGIGVCRDSWVEDIA